MGGGLPNLLQYYNGGGGGSLGTPNLYYVIYGRPLMVMVMMVDVDDIVNRPQAKEAKPGIDDEINNDNAEIIIKIIKGDLNDHSKKDKNNNEKKTDL